MERHARGVLDGRSRSRLLLVRMLHVCFLLALSLQAYTFEAHLDKFDAGEATIESVHHALLSGSVSCREVVASFIARIEAYNPIINAISALNPEALQIADGLDAQLRAGNFTGKLFCIPVLLKDNFDAIPMYTTGSCLALAHKLPQRDGLVVQAFRREGAVILGKTNLHEMALEGISVSSLGGQTFNPYDRSRTPGGSSGGTGAAIATSLAVFGTGTDTMNSLRNPASANNLVSLRPTRGLISRSGVIPVSHTQDTVGPIARTIDDLAVALSVMVGAGSDPVDNVTLLVPDGERGRDYSIDLHTGKLQGLRLGILSGFWNLTNSDETTPVNEAMNETLEFFRTQGVELVDITDTIYNAAHIGATLDVQKYEYRQLLNKYLGSTRLHGDGPSSFEELYAGNEFLVLPHQYSFIYNARHSSTSDRSYLTTLDGIERLAKALRRTFLDNDLDAIVYPEQMNLVVKLGSPSQVGRNGILAALTGHPVVTVPVGFSVPTEDAPIGVPIGMEVLGVPYTEAQLLQMAWQLTHHRPLRKPPVFAPGLAHVPDYSTVPVVRPSKDNIVAAYAIGRL